MAVSTSRSGGIYITVSGDYSQFEKDMRKIRAMANTTATDISRAMSGAMSSTSATKNITKLSSSFQQAQRSAKAMTADMSRLDQKFKEIGQTIGVTQRDLGKFSAIQQRAFQHQGSQVFEKSLKDIQRLIGQANEEIHLLTRTLGGTGQGFSTTAAAAQSLGNTLATVKGAAIAAAVAFATGALVTYADSYTNLQNTLKIVTGDQAEFTSMMAGVLTVANASATSIGETTTNFYRLHNALKDLGATKEEVLRLTETLQKLSIHISGGSTEQAAIAMQQFTMSLTSGTVSAREYRSTISTMPMLLNALMKAAGKATEEELDEAVKKGQVTSMHLFTALASIPKQIDTLYATLGTTMGQALTVFGNNITATVGAIDDAFGVSAGVAKGMESLSEKIRNSSGELITFISYVDNAAVALGAYVLVSWKGAAVMAVIATRAKVAGGALLLNVTAFRMLTATCGVASAALTVATVATTRMIVATKALTVAMLKNPVFLAITAASALYSLRESMQKTKAQAEDVQLSFDRWAKKAASATQNTKELAKSLATVRLESEQLALQNAQEASQKQLGTINSQIQDMEADGRVYTIGFGVSEWETISEATRTAVSHIKDMQSELSKAVTTTEKLDIAALTFAKINDILLVNPADEAIKKTLGIMKSTIGLLHKVEEAEEALATAEGLVGMEEQALQAVGAIKELAELTAQIREQAVMPKNISEAHASLVKFTQGMDESKKAQWEHEKAVAAHSIALMEQALTVAKLHARILSLGALASPVIRVQLDIVTADIEQLETTLSAHKKDAEQRIEQGMDGGKRKGKGGGGGGGGGVDEGKEYARQTSKKIADVEQEILYLQKEQAGVSQEQIELLKMKYAHTKSLNELEEQADKAKMLGSSEYKDMVRLTTQLHTMKLRVVEYEAAWAPVTSQLQHAIDLANALGESTDKATLALKQQQLFMAQLPTSPGYGTLANDRQIELLKAESERIRKNKDNRLFDENKDYLLYSPEAAKREQQRLKETEAQINEMQQRGLIGEETASAARQRVRAQEQGGVIGGMQAYYDSIQSFSVSLAEATFNALQGVEDFFVTMITKLEFDFSTLVDSILADLARIVVQQSITKPLAGWLANMLPNAHGNTYAAGSGLGQYQNQVVSSPTVFAFASGGVPNFGLMGEKLGSPGEAIMPLTRVGGDLGVKAIVGQPQAPVMQVNVYEAAGTKATVSQSDDGSSLDVIVEMIANKMQSRIDRGAMQGLQKKRAYI